MTSSLTAPFPGREWNRYASEASTGSYRPHTESTWVMPFARSTSGFAALDRDERKSPCGDTSVTALCLRASSWAFAIWEVPNFARELNWAKIESPSREAISSGCNNRGFFSDAERIHFSKSEFNHQGSQDEHPAPH